MTWTIYQYHSFILNHFYYSFDIRISFVFGGVFVVVVVVGGGGGGGSGCGGGGGVFCWFWR